MAFLNDFVGWGKILILNLLVPGLVGVITYYLTHKLDALQKSTITRKVTLAVFEAYQSDLKTGVAQIKTAFNSPVAVNLPTESWQSFKLSENQIAEVLIVSRNTVCGFPLRSFLVHLKNYFEHITKNVVLVAPKQMTKDRQVLLQDHLEATQKVLLMVDAISRALTPKWYQFWRKL